MGGQLTAANQPEIGKAYKLDSLNRLVGGMGALETCMIASPLLMIIANDLVAMARKLKEGLVLDDDTLGFQELLDAKEDGVFLDLEHT